VIQVFHTLIALAAAAPSVAPGGPATASSAATAAQRWTFEDAEAGKAPLGFDFAQTGEGRAGRWATVPGGYGSPDGQALGQLDGDTHGDRYLMAIAHAPALRDLRLSVRCKPVSGQFDQACGLVFRYQDAGNYYLTRANALEGNVRLYHVKGGKRTQIATWSGRVDEGEWQELRVAALGDLIEVRWDGKPVLTATDATFPEPGRIGLWTKADSVTYFDDLTVVPLGGGAAAPAAK
jgi:hypothetical protein